MGALEFDIPSSIIGAAIAGGVALLAAIIGQLVNRATQRRSATLQHFQRQTWDKDYIEARNKLGSVRRLIELATPEQLDQLLSPEFSTDSGDKPANLLRSILNEFELLAL